jgi:hypothetical protein
MQHTDRTRHHAYGVRARAHRARLDTWQLRCQIAQLRQRALLMRLARYMPEANPITREITAAILAQHGLGPDEPPPARSLCSQLDGPGIRLRHQERVRAVRGRRS